MENKLEETQIQIPTYSRVKVYWDDRPENYTREGMTRIKNHFATKYGVTKNNIEVIFRPVKFDEKGNVIEITGAGIENIMDVNYQRELFKTWIEREKKNVDFDRILKLDDKVNAELNIDINELIHRKWSIKWLMIDNFLSFGDENFVSFSKLHGLTVVNSIPENQGGKTNLTIDAIKFLLYGNTTKTDKNEQIFNSFRDKNELVVRGMITLEDEEIIIERKMRRSAKKGGGWTITNKVNYYEILPDGEEKELNDEHATLTTKKIRKTIGSEADFELVTLATARNLEDLIDFTSTESGKMLNRFIGLEVIHLKDAVVREMYNKFTKTMKSNEYDVVTLTNDIEEHKEKISLGETAHKNLVEQLEATKESIINLNNEKERLLATKQQVDVSVIALNPSKLEKEIAEITELGLTKTNLIKEKEKAIEAIGKVDFDEDRHHFVVGEINKLNTSIALDNAEVKRLDKVIEDLISGGICQSCNRPLEGVDHSSHIEEHKMTSRSIAERALNSLNILQELKDELVILNDVKKLIDEKNKLELERDRLEVDLGGLRNELIEKKVDLKKYNANLDSIEFNRKVDGDISLVKTNINVAEIAKDNYIVKVERMLADIESNKTSILTKDALITQIKKEEEIEKIFKVYIEMVGKKGISKIVLRSVLPIINSEIQRLLEDIVDFKVEIFMDDKNEVQYLLSKDGVSKLLKSGSGFERTASALALRTVLGKVSTLPMPNFMTFDEVTGKVAASNIEALKPLFERIKEMYDIVFLITHNEVVKDWGTKIITVVKENNISKLEIK